MTQRTKLDALEAKFQRTKPYRPPNRGLFQVGKAILIHIWQVVKMLDLMQADGWHSDTSWIKDARPSHEELLEIAEIANMVENVEIEWSEIE